MSSDDFFDLFSNETDLLKCENDKLRGENEELQSKMQDLYALIQQLSLEKQQLILEKQQLTESLLGHAPVTVPVYATSQENGFSTEGLDPYSALSSLEASSPFASTATTTATTSSPPQGTDPMYELNELQEMSLGGGFDNIKQRLLTDGFTSMIQEERLSHSPRLRDAIFFAEIGGRLVVFLNDKNGSITINKEKMRVTTYFSGIYLQGFKRSRFNYNNRQFLLWIGDAFSNSQALGFTELPVRKRLQDF